MTVTYIIAIIYTWLYTLLDCINVHMKIGNCLKILTFKDTENTKIWLQATKSLKVVYTNNTWPKDTFLV